MNTARLTAARAAVDGLSFATRLSLRVGPDDRATVFGALGLDLPLRIGMRMVAGGRSALCLGPDEWMVEAAENDSGAVVATLAELAPRVPMSVVDVSDRETTLVLTGTGVLDLLATGCPLDLARMPVGAGTRTVFDSVQVVLTREAEDRFHLVVWRSFAPHVRALLEIALRELAAGL